MASNVLGDLSYHSRLPAPFDTEICGSLAKFSDENSVVERKEYDEYPFGAVCLTAHPLTPGKVWEITWSSKTNIWSWGSFGLSICVSSNKPDYANQDMEALVSENNLSGMVYKGTNLYESHRYLDFDLPNLNESERVGFLPTAEGTIHIYVDGLHVKEVKSYFSANQPVWGVVDVNGTCTNVKSEVLTYDPELARKGLLSEYSERKILKAALRDGFIPHKDDKFLIHGPGGVGKSSLIAMFLGKQRDLLRVSTPVANQPIHISPVRDVCAKTYTADWEEVDYDRLSQMLANTTEDVCQRWVATQKKEKKIEGSKSVHTPSSDESSQRVAYLTSSRHLDSSRKAKFNKAVGRFRSGVGNLFKKSLTDTLGEDPHNIEGFFTEFQQGLQDLVREPGSTGEVLVSHSIRIIDSGGQPQFHDLLSIFIPELSGLVSVFKLCEPLSVRGEVVFYKDGKMTCAPYESYYTNEHVIRHDLQVIQSEATRSGLKHIPNLAFVGTHLDTYSPSTCSESPDDKDQRLHSIITEVLPEEMHESVISAGGSLKNVAFRVNAREPRGADFRKVDQLKQILLEKSQVKSNDLPLSWFGYEVALHLLMQQLGRQCLSRKECEFIAHKLGFDAPSLNAALQYLRKLNILSFFDVLPSVIFGSSQVILDKITELVTYNLELKDDTEAMAGARRKFLHQGIVSLEILQSHKCSRHYVESLFGPRHLLDILVSKLVVTEVAPHEFMMPSVLEVSDIYPSPPVPEDSVRSSFVLHFSKKSPMIGVYCCTISYLLTKAGWKLLTEGGEVVQVARNSITFELPCSLPGTLTFLDPLSSYLEVVIELPAIIVGKGITATLHKIRDTLSVAIMQAMETLNYEMMTPELSFLCPVQTSLCSTLPHVANANLSLNLLICSVNHRVIKPLTADHRRWLKADSKGGIEQQVVDGSEADTSPVSLPYPMTPGDEPTLPQNPTVAVGLCNPERTNETKDDRTPEKKTTVSPLSDSEPSKDKAPEEIPMDPPIKISCEKPTLPELLEMDLPTQVGGRFNEFGTLLLRDNRGAKMAIIFDSCQGRPERMTLEVLRQWLVGKGVEVSWESLISTLNKSKLPLMASQIQMALDRLRS